MLQMSRGALVVCSSFSQLYHSPGEHKKETCGPSQRAQVQAHTDIYTFQVSILFFSNIEFSETIPYNEMLHVIQSKVIIKAKTFKWTP